MASLNVVQLIGNLGRDPECRYLPSGDLVVSVSLATTESWKAKDGSKQEKTTWHNLEIFGKTAEVVRDYCTKGRQLYVQGSLQIDEWEDKEGTKKQKAKIKVSGPNAKVILLGGGSGQRRDERSEEPAGAADLEDTPF